MFKFANRFPIQLKDDPSSKTVQKSQFKNYVQQKNASIADYRQLVRLLHTAEKSVAVNYFPKTEANIFEVSRFKCLGV